MNKIVKVIAIVLMFSAVVSAEISDHLYEVGLYYNLHPAISEGGFHIEAATDDSVKEVKVYTPGGAIFVIPAVEDTWDSDTQIYTEYECNDGDCYWGTGQDFSDLTAFNSFGEGYYQVELIYNDLSSESSRFWYGKEDMSGPLDFPAHAPVVVSPQEHESVSGEITIEWEADHAVDLYHCSLECTDPDEDEFSMLINNTSTNSVDLTLKKGIWDLEVVYANGSFGYVNEDDIQYGCVKALCTELYFAYDMPWTVYEVWGANDAVRSIDDVRYGDLVLLGYSDGATQTFRGNFPYYAIVSREAINIDCITGNTGNNYYGSFDVYNVMDQGNVIGPADDVYATVGAYGDWRQYNGLLSFANIYGWSSIMVTTDSEKECPTADLTGDCHVDIYDLAVLASQWME